MATQHSIVAYFQRAANNYAAGDSASLAIKSIIILDDISDIF